MSQSNADPRLDREVARLRRLGLERDRRSGRVLLASAIAGLVVGVWTWLGQDPMDRQGSVAAAAGFLVFMVGFSLSLFGEGGVIKCPRRGFDWAEEGRAWPSWKCCPGCGLKMTEDTTVSSGRA